MNIQELVKQAIERIDSMSIDELRAKFLEHGYIPSDQKHHSSYLFTVQGDVSVRLNATDSPLIPDSFFILASQSATNHVNYLSFDCALLNDPNNHSINIISADQYDYSTLNSSNLKHAA